jgi:starch synthase
MEVIVFGTRGIPNISGGVETHCEELYPYLVNDGDINVTVIVRSKYVNQFELNKHRGVRLKTIYAPKNKVFEAIIHSILSVFYAAIKRPDIVHIHAVGPNLVAPLARFLGLKVVMTHHGPDYERKKWGKIAKIFLKTGEWAGVTFANKVIVISEEIQISIAKKYNRRDSILIPNGVSISGVPEYEESVLKKYDLERCQYIFTLGRFVPEKGFDYLIDAYKNANINSNIKLVIAGNADHVTKYSSNLKQQANEAGIVLTGFIKGNDLAQLFSNCNLFILPSFYEGLPIALLEAMAYGLPILASDINANTQVNLPAENYFKVGDVKELVKKIEGFYTGKIIHSKKIYNMENYNWKNIAASTLKVYHSL